MKIAFFDMKSINAREFFGRSLKGMSVDFYEESLSMRNAEKAGIYDVVCVSITSKITKHIAGMLERTKLIVTRSTGYDHIDIEACKRHGIKVCNIPGYSTSSVAEHTITMMLAVAKKIKEYALIQDHKFPRLKGMELKGKTLGIIGFGAIGQEVAKIAKAMGMNVVVYDAYCRNYEGIACVSLDGLLKNADIISLHAPHTEETHHMIDRCAIEKMKDGVIIINTARGGVIDSKALLDGIESGKIEAAGLDVIENEEMLISVKGRAKGLEGHIRRLISSKKVVYTPHIAAYTEEAITRLRNSIVECIKAFINEEKEKLNIIS